MNVALSVRSAAGVSATTTGRDAIKKVPGRENGLAVDVLGLVIAVVVAASVTVSCFLTIISSGMGEMRSTNAPGS
ncbi:hypothetical protein [Nonomuraea sp. NPDC049129]|uniref:hypothetical protein n=1 Tax=Nonomuraea sp. NPDC049129 TaxID=3155272 RepID=UPI0034020767